MCRSRFLVVISEEICLSGKTLDCRLSDCESDPPHSNLNYKKEICIGSSQDKRVSLLYTGHDKESGL